MASAAPWWLKLKSWILSPLSLPVKAPCLSIREPRDLFLFVCLGALTLPSALCKSVLNLSVKLCTPPVCCSAAELWPSCREREIKTVVVNNRRENKNRPEGQQGKWKPCQLIRVTTQIKNLPGTCSLRFLRLHDCQQRPLLSRDQVKTRSIWSPFSTTGTFPRSFSGAHQLHWLWAEELGFQFWFRSTQNVLWLQKCVWKTVWNCGEFASLNITDSVTVSHLLVQTGRNWGDV